MHVKSSSTVEVNLFESFNLTLIYDVNDQFNFNHFISVHILIEVA